MVFSSMTFLMLFLPATLLLYFLCDRITWRNGVLLLASLVFYAWGEPVMILLMLVSVAVNYVCALGIENGRSRSAKRVWLWAGVAASTVFLLYFKYFAFFVNSFAAVFAVSGRVAEKSLPIGISFYTFQILTYTIDVYRGKVRAQKDPAALLLYVSCFPQLIAGPIVQYSDVAYMLKNRISTMSGFARGARRFAIGLGKKVLIANICGKAVEMIAPVTDRTQALSVSGAWYAAIMYTFQIYFDFSAYSDMAIGLGKIFGFEYKENFNYPYLSGSVSEFWRRWHISLGSFFRDYVYIPLGGNRRSTGRTVLNLIIVWSLTGMWHGASWNFILWGAFYGLLIIFERFVIKKERMERIPVLFRLPAVLIITVFGWVIFYHTDFSLGARHMLAMIGLDGSQGSLISAPLSDPLTAAVFRKFSVFPLIAAAACLPIVPALRKRFSSSGWYEPASYVLATAVLVLSVIFLVGESYNPFIYFRF